MHRSVLPETTYGTLTEAAAMHMLARRASRHGIPRDACTRCTRYTRPIIPDEQTGNFVVPFIVVSWPAYQAHSFSIADKATRKSRMETRKTSVPGKLAALAQITSPPRGFFFRTAAADGLALRAGTETSLFPNCFYKKTIHHKH